MHSWKTAVVVVSVEMLVFKTGLHVSTLAPPNEPHRNVHYLLAMLAFALAPRAMLAPVLVAVAGARCRQVLLQFLCLHQVTSLGRQNK